MTELAAQEMVWIETLATITVHELSRASGLSAAQLQELVEYAALLPVAQTHPSELMFSAECVVPLRTACTLQADYDLDLFTVGVLVGYLFRIESLERQVQSLRAQLPVLPVHSAHREM